MKDLPSEFEKEESKMILREYRKMKTAITTETTSEDRDNIRKAFEVAIDAHKDQRRKSGEPYIFHPIEVARICAAEIGLGPTAIVAALLHDVVEDSEYKIEQIEELFNPRVALIVDGLTKLDNIYDVQLPQAENFKKILMTLSKDVRVCLIKLADRLHNMRTLGSMPAHKQLRIASETSFIYAPLAHRLGLYSIKTELQDLCMKILDPDNYHAVADKLRDTKNERKKYINEFVKPLQEEFDTLDMPYRVSGRPKSISSIYNKILKKKVPFEEVYDLFAVRIIIDVPPKMEKRKCWEIYSIITDIYRPIPERLKDWVTIPKANGYESLHTTVIGPGGRFVEVQVRSERMDEISEKGFAAHWKYKGVNSHDDIFDRWLNNVREILDMHQDMDSPEFMADFQTSLFKDEVYVFTPNGEMKLLPKGATALDFAFHIHSEIGSHCIGVKVNSKQEPMHYVLRNGDQVSVTTSKTQKPNDSWIKMCITGKAKSKIRQALNEERRKKAEFGKEALERKLSNSFKVKFDDTNIEFLVKYFGLDSRLDLFFAIAQEDINLSRDLKSLEVVVGKLTEKKIEIPVEKKVEELRVESSAPAVKKGKKKSNRPVIYINGEEGTHFSYTFATCCSPVQGDDIFCYINAQNEMKVHRKSCVNAQNLLVHYGYRVLKAEWANNVTSSFVVDLKIFGMDSIGMTHKMTDMLTNQLKVDIRKISLGGQSGYFEGDLSVVVFNTNQLNLLVKTLKTLEGVSEVYRVN